MNYQGIVHTSPIVPVNDTSLIPTHYSVFGAGGLHEVFDISERNSISVETFLHEDGMGSGRRRNGMVVYVSSQNTSYQLNVPNYNSLTSSQKLVGLANNSNWVFFGTGTYLYQAITGSTGITINHNLNLFPQSLVLDENNVMVMCAPKYNNSNSISYSFNYGITGSIILQASIKNS